MLIVYLAATYKQVGDKENAEKFAREALRLDQNLEKYAKEFIASL